MAAADARLPAPTSPTVATSVARSCPARSYAHTGEEGGHTISEWYSKVRSGGVFGGHDYSKKWPLTKEAVDAWAKAARLELHVIGPAVKEQEPAADNDCCPSWWAGREACMSALQHGREGLCSFACVLLYRPSPAVLHWGPTAVGWRLLVPPRCLFADAGVFPRLCCSSAAWV